MTNTSSCIFCKIIKGQIPSYKIYEDKNYLAFLDISQFTRGHTLVIPKKHVDFVWDSAEICQYFSVITKIANHFRSLGFTYVDSMIFGRDVVHAHVHLIPHNDNSKDYKSAISGLGKLQGDLKRRPAPEVMEQTVKDFKI